MVMIEIAVTESLLLREDTLNTMGDPETNGSRRLLGIIIVTTITTRTVVAADDPRPIPIIVDPSSLIESTDPVTDPVIERRDATICHRPVDRLDILTMTPRLVLTKKERRPPRFPKFKKEF